MSMQNVPVAACGDGISRPEGGNFFPLTSTNAAVNAKTASYTVTAKDAFKAFSNTGASGAVTFTLPSPSAALGQPFVFIQDAAQNLVIAAPAGATINTASSLTNASASSQNGKAMAIVWAYNSTEYIAMLLGTWS